MVNQNKQIEVRNVKTSGTFQGQWVVTDGLTNGESVVVVGGAKVKPEQAVEIRPYLPNGQTQGAGQAPSQAPNAQAPQQGGASQQGQQTKQAQQGQAPTAPAQNVLPTDDDDEQAKLKQ